MTDDCNIVDDARQGEPTSHVTLRIDARRLEQMHLLDTALFRKLYRHHSPAVILESAFTSFSLQVLWTSFGFYRVHNSWNLSQDLAVPAPT
jgi:hypothetical protein